jgi:5-methylcytosine-specific restriction endonuclease McrA
MSRTARPRRNTTRRDRYRRQLSLGQPPCAIEGCQLGPIDYQAHHLDPRAFTIDHITPLAAGGTDTLDNLQPAHRACNRTKSDTTPTGTTTPTWATWRTW